jgi:hypothetical protein
MITRSGMAVFVVMVVFAVAGFALGYPEFVMVAAAAACALLVAGAWLRILPECGSFPR